MLILYFILLIKFIKIDLLRSEMCVYFETEGVTSWWHVTLRSVWLTNPCSTRLAACNFEVSDTHFQLDRLAYIYWLLQLCNSKPTHNNNRSLQLQPKRKRKCCATIV